MRRTLNSNRKIEMGFESQAQYETFKKDYAKALEDKVEMFSSQKRSFIVGYAKYLIEYIDEEVKKKGEVREQ